MLGSRIITAIVVVVGVPAITVGYVALIEWVLGRLSYDMRRRLRPWLWLAPLLVILAVYLVYPTIVTTYLSFFNANSTKFVGLENYHTLFTNPSGLITLRNNLLWLVLVAGAVVTFGLLFAVIFDRVSYEAAAKALIFVPMAISFVAASVIWKLMYDYQPPGAPQTGTLDAIVVALGGQPIPWVITQPLNTFMLIIVGVWMWTGFGLVILSAGLKSIPTEILEAARVDGANEFQILIQIIIPMMGSTIAVVATTMIINALKAFDIVYTMTSGNFNSDVLANQMYKQMFLFNNFGYASAIAVVLLLAIVPVMIINIRRFQAQEAIR
jgi:alpha-glucoside transport system permease protein